MTALTKLQADIVKPLAGYRSETSYAVASNSRNRHLT